MRVRAVYVRDDGVAEIPLSRGLVALVDEADAHIVSGRNWTAGRAKAGNWYAKSRIGGKNIMMHKVLLPNVTQVDHKNGNGLDNRRSSNLRPATGSQNMANQRKRRGCTSQYKGVYWRADRHAWVAQISMNFRRVMLGRFDSEVEAARAYNAAAAEYYGEYARLNVIEQDATA